MPKKTSERIPELGNRTWAELECSTSEDGHIVFSDFIKRRKTDGGFENVPIKLRIPRAGDHFEARRMARVMATQVGIDEEKDSDLFAELEQLCLLSKAVRDRETGAQLEAADDLASGNLYDTGSLEELLGRMKVYKDLLDPRDMELTEDEIIEKTVAVAERGHLLPLTGIAGHEQPSFVVSMAQLACTSPKVKSWLRSHENSTPAH